MNFLNSVKKKINSITKTITAPLQIVQITNNIYHISYPNSSSQLQQMIAKLPNKNCKIQLWNISQYHYPHQLFNQLANVGVDLVNLTYQYYSSIPFTIAVSRIKSIKRFLSSSSQNVVFLHCQSNKGRSSVFLAMYIFLTGIVQDVASATVMVNQKLKIQSKQQTIYGSQHSILKNIAIYHQDMKCINKNHYKLIKVIINHAPKIPQIQQNFEGLQTYFQVKKNDTILVKMVTQQYGQGQALHFIMKQRNIILYDDCLISLKYIHNNKLYPVIRAQINTNFIYNNFIRLQMQQIDIVSNAHSKYVFVDIILQTISNTQSDLWNISNRKQQFKYKQMIKDDIKQSKTQQQNVLKKQQNYDLLNLRADKQKQKKQQRYQNIQMMQKGQKQLQKDQFDFEIGGQTIQVINQTQIQQKINKRLQRMQLKRQKLKQTLDQIQAQQQQQNQQFEFQQNDQQLDKDKSQQAKINELLISMQKKQNQQQQQNDDEMDDYFAKLQKQA